MKATVQKIETLNDGSIKLSLYARREDLSEAVKYDNKTVEISVAEESHADEMTAEIMAAFDKLMGDLFSQYNEYKARTGNGRMKVIGMEEQQAAKNETAQFMNEVER